MNLVHATTIGQRIQKRAERITGTNIDPATYAFGNTGIAETAGSAISFNKQWLANASKQEVKGVIAHELGHVLQGAGSTLSGVQQESYGDALRARMGLGVGQGYNSTQEKQMERLSNAEFRQLSSMAQSGSIDRGWLKEAGMAGTDGNGPKAGAGGRRRNTAANLFSKNTLNYQNPGGAQALPAMSPSQTANYYSQLAGLYAGYQNQLAALKLQRVGARADFRAQAADVRAQKLTGLADTENAAIERGVVGSSADLQARAGVRGAAETQLQSAKQQRAMTVAESRLGAQQAGTQYFMGVQGLEATKLAAQQEALSNQLEQNLIVSGQESTMNVLKAIYDSLTANYGGGGGGNGGGGGGGNKPAVFDYEAWRKAQAKNAGKSLNDFISAIFAGKTGL